MVGLVSGWIMYLWRAATARYGAVAICAREPMPIHRFAFSSMRGLRRTDAPPDVSLTFHNNSSVAILTLCNPKRRNALTTSMMEELDRHVQTLSKWSSGGIVGGTGNEEKLLFENEISHDKQRQKSNARVVILTGSNNTFCSGLDLHDNEENDAQNINDSNDTSMAQSLKEGSRMIHHMTRVTNQLLSLPVLSVSAIDGYAVGGGAELTTCTDMVVLSRNAKIQFVHAKRGASAGWGGLRRLVKKVGRGRALRMFLLGEQVCGEKEALVGGIYADAIGEEGETALDATMRLVVDPIMELPCSLSIRSIKKAVSAADGDGEAIDSATGRIKMDTNLAMKGEFESFMSVWGGDSNREQIQKAKERLRKKDEKK